MSCQVALTKVYPRWRCARLRGRIPGRAGEQGFRTQLSLIISFLRFRAAGGEVTYRSNLNATTGKSVPLAACCGMRLHDVAFEKFIHKM